MSYLSINKRSDICDSTNNCCISLIFKACLTLNSRIKHVNVEKMSNISHSYL
jgi:hypothetical protein